MHSRVPINQTIFVTVADLRAGHWHHSMMDNLQEAYTSYQQALYHLRDPKVCRDILGEVDQS